VVVFVRRTGFQYCVVTHGHYRRLLLECRHGSIIDAGGTRRPPLGVLGVAPTRLDDVHAIANWWDGIELWITGLPFVPQSIVVLLVVVPCAFGLAWTFDRLLASILHLVGRDARAERDATEVASKPSIATEVASKPSIATKVASKPSITEGS
jgi:hypothetical protein